MGYGESEYIVIRLLFHGNDTNMSKKYCSYYSEKHGSQSRSSKKCKNERIQVFGGVDTFEM